MLFGVEYMLRNFHRKRVPERDQQSFGLFLQDRINLSSMWSLLAAVRLDKVEGIDAVMSPKISTLYRPIAPLALRASIGRGFRAPTVQDLYETLYTHPGDIHYRAGNPDLEPEYSTSITSGIEWTPFRQLSMMLNGYYYQIDNMITPIDHGLEDPTLYFPREQIPFVRDSLVYVYRRENIHHAVIGGGELKMMWNFAPGYSLEGGVTLIHNENKDTGESLPYYPGKSFSFKFTGVQSIGSRVSVKGFVGLNAAQDRKIWRFKHSGEQIVKLNNYQKLDAGLSLLFSNSYELFVNADNLLGQELYIYEDLVFQIEGTPLFRAGLRLTM
jgi:outer membrane receptor protein involved in Fe transport